MVLDDLPELVRMVREDGVGPAKMIEGLKVGGAHDHPFRVRFSSAVCLMTASLLLPSGPWQAQVESLKKEAAMYVLPL